MNNYENWSFGYELTEQEAIAFYEADNGREVVAHIANQKLPGQALGDPFTGHVTLQLPDTTVFQIKFDEAEFGGLGRVTYMAAHYNAEDMAAIVVRQIVETNSEVAVALTLHLESSEFGKDNDLTSNLLEWFWFRTPGLTQYQLEWIDYALRQESAPYRTLLEFLNDPKIQKFAYLSKEINSRGDFSRLYGEASR
jgi:hypothetical protein